MLSLWAKVKIALSVIFGIAGALFFFLLGIRSAQEESDIQQEADKNRKKAKRLKKDTEKLLDQVDRTKKKAEQVRQEVEERKSKRDEKAKEYFTGL